MLEGVFASSDSDNSTSVTASQHQGRSLQGVAAVLLFVTAIKGCSLQAQCMERANHSSTTALVSTSYTYCYQHLAIKRTGTLYC